MWNRKQKQMKEANLERAIFIKRMGTKKKNIRKKIRKKKM